MLWFDQNGFRSKAGITPWISRDEMKRPRVSVGLPVYNGQKFIESTLVSILSQDYEDFELIISDNASEDKTESICRRYAEMDSRIRYSRFHQNTGIVNNFNHVFKLSRGEYFKWAAYDDECQPTFLRRCVEVLESAPDSVAMVYPQAEWINEEGRAILTGLDRIGSRDVRPHRRLARVLWALTFCDPFWGLIKSKFLRKTQLLGPFFGGDNVILCELAMLGEIWELDEILFRLRQHPSRTMDVYSTARARAEFYDSSAARKLFIMPSWERMVCEILKAVWRSPLHPAEKVKCSMVVPGVHYWRRFRNAGGRVKNKMKACYSRLAFP
jgi:glycosyltransferase involved in cell wall biosynthesis